ncbi:MAG: T9SS type A sorting domain-containing protein [candidate division Zixibacteria bacterium]|nr:T9SS type A sorting domain-containing protein [candidate division Zixibacteria bacterium]
MKKVLLLTIIFALSTVNGIYAQDSIKIVFEDYNDQDIFNNFSGDWNKWGSSLEVISFNFDTLEYRGNYGNSLRIDYSFSQGNIGSIWNSLIGKVNYNNQFLNFTDLYGDLNNSSGNPSSIEDVEITQFNFWAKGNGDGDFYHVVKVEFKDVNDPPNTTSKTFNIPNTSDWTEYHFPVGDMSGVDSTKMKEMAFVLSDTQNNFRTSYFYIDDLSFNTTEISYDAGSWSDDQFLDLISHRSFKYFYNFTDTLGFALDRSTFSDLVSVGAIGFQLAAYCIGDSRDWADDLEDRTETILYNLSSLPMGSGPGNAGYKGFYYHFLDANTGIRKNNGVELSLYDTGLLMYGVLTCKEHFHDNTDIQQLAQDLYDSVQWDWMVDTTSGPNQNQFCLAWSPESGFIGHVDGYTDEALLIDVMALGSDTYPTTMETYNIRRRTLGAYPIDNPERLAASWTGSLFTYTFGCCWLDIEPRGYDRHALLSLDIWENNRRAAAANHQFCIDHQENMQRTADDKYTTYGDSSWGLTACDNLVDVVNTGMLSEYYAFGALPTEQNIFNPQTKAPHLGTIALYGAGSAITLTPNESIGALRYYYSFLNLWDSFLGFCDAYSTDPHYFEVDYGYSTVPHYFEKDAATYEPILDSDGNLIIHPADWLNGPWVNKMIMGINVGPMLLAIENYRSDFIWNLTNSNANISVGLDSCFFGEPEQCLVCNTVCQTPNVPRENGTIQWDMTVINCGTAVFTPVVGEIFPTNIDCNGPQFDFNLISTVTPSLTPGDSVTNYYYFLPGAVTSQIVEAALWIYVGAEANNYINGCCFEFAFTSQWNRDDASSWGANGVWGFRDNENLPNHISLHQNYPNPFNSNTTIEYTLPQASHVVLKVFNIMGQCVETLVDENQRQGYKAINWNASQYSSGIYFYKLTTEEKVLTKRMVLLK